MHLYIIHYFVVKLRFQFSNGDGKVISCKKCYFLSELGISWHHPHRCACGLFGVVSLWIGCCQQISVSWYSNWKFNWLSAIRIHKKDFQMSLDPRAVWQRLTVGSRCFPHVDDYFNWILKIWYVVTKKIMLKT